MQSKDFDPKPSNIISVIYVPVLFLFYFFHSLYYESNHKNKKCIIIVTTIYIN